MLGILHSHQNQRHVLRCPSSAGIAALPATSQRRRRSRAAAPRDARCDSRSFFPGFLLQPSVNLGPGSLALADTHLSSRPAKTRPPGASTCALASASDAGSPSTGRTPRLLILPEDRQLLLSSAVFGLPFAFVLARIFCLAFPSSSFSIFHSWIILLAAAPTAPPPRTRRGSLANSHDARDARSLLPMPPPSSSSSTPRTRIR